MEDFHAWNELNFREKILAIDNFRKHEKENFDDDYTALQAIDVLRERDYFVKDIDDGKVVNVY
jgi:hypothetical protein